MTVNYISGNGRTAIMALSGAGVSTGPTVTYTGADPTTPGTFDTTSQNFQANGSSTSFSNNNPVVFDDSATGPTTAIAVAAGGVSPFSVTFANNAKPYSLAAGSGPIAGVGGLAVVGGGSVELDNVNTYTGITSVASGTLTIGATGGIASSYVTVANGSTFTVMPGGQLTSSTLTVLDNGTVNFNNPRSLAALNGTGALVVQNASPLTLNGGNFTGTITGGSSLTLNFGGSLGATIADGAAGPLPVTMTSGGTLALTATSTYTGGTNLSAGTLQAGTSGSLGTGPITFAGGTLGTTTASTTASPVTLSNPILFTPATGISLDATNAIVLSGPLAVPAGTSNLTVANGDNTTLARGKVTGLISGPGGLNLTGFFQITQANTYAGGTTFNAATNVGITSNAAFGTGPLTFNNGGFGGLAGTGPFTGTNAVANSYGFGGLNNAFLEDAVALELSGAGTLPTNGATGSVFVYAPSAKLSGVLGGGGTGGLTLGAGSGSNTLELSNPGNTYTGPTAVVTGVLQVDAGGALGGTSAVNVSSGGQLLANDNTGTIGLVGGVAVPTNLAGLGTTANQNGALVGPVGLSATYAGALNLSSGALVGIGGGVGGTLTLTGPITSTNNTTPVSFSRGNNSTTVLTPAVAGSVTYAGETRMPGGLAGGTNVLRAGTANAFSPNSGINFTNANAGAAVVDLNGFNQTVAYLTATAKAGSAVTNTATTPAVLTINTANSTVNTAPVFASAITDNAANGGTLALVMAGAGTQTLSGANTYTGGTTVNAGTLAATTNGSLGTGTVTLGGGTLALSALGTTTTTGTAAFTQFNHSGSFVPTNTNNVLQLSQSGTNNTAATTFVPITVNDLGSFSATFTYTHTTATSAGNGTVADGISFGFQNDPRGLNALGGQGGSEAYSAGTGGTLITKSEVGYIDLYNYDYGLGANGVLGRRRPTRTCRPPPRRRSPSPTTARPRRSRPRSRPAARPTRRPRRSTWRRSSAGRPAAPRPATSGSAGRPAARPRPRTSPTSPTRNRPRPT